MVGFFLYVSKVAWLSLGKYLQGIAFGRWWWWGDRRHCAINRISKGCINNKSQQRIILVSTCFETSLEAKSAKTRRISLLQEKRGGDENNSRAYFLAFFAGLWVSLECQAGWLEGVLSWKKTIPAFNTFKANVLKKDFAHLLFWMWSLALSAKIRQNILKICKTWIGSIFLFILKFGLVLSCTFTPLVNKKASFWK